MSNQTQEQAAVNQLNSSAAGAKVVLTEDKIKELKTDKEKIIKSGDPVKK